MKLKYYLRGAGLGIIFATLIMILTCSLHNNEMSREEIIEEAEKLGMVMPGENDSQDDSKMENDEPGVGESQGTVTENPASEPIETEKIK